MSGRDLDYSIDELEKRLSRLDPESKEAQKIRNRLAKKKHYQESSKKNRRAFSESQKWDSEYFDDDLDME